MPRLQRQSSQQRHGEGGAYPRRAFLKVVIGDEQKMKKYEKPLVLLLFRACTAAKHIGTQLPVESLDCFGPQEGFIGNRKVDGFAVAKRRLSRARSPKGDLSGLTPRPSKQSLGYT